MKTRTPIILLIFALIVPVVAAEPFKVVVNAGNQTTSINKTTLSNYFLGKATRWPDGSAVKPIDLPETSDVRAQFSRQIFGKETASVKSYWLQVIFAGRGTPPPHFATDGEVLANIRSNPGAIGYVSASTPLGGGVKAISVVE